jgi:hypothetical protein
LPGGNYGGGGTLFDRFVGYCSYVTDWPFVAIHEVSHTLDTIYANSGFEEFEFNHGLWAVRSVSGGDLIVNGEIVRKIPDSTFSTLAPPFERIIEAADPDHDGLVEGPLFPVSESSTNANPDREDSDFDGVSDLFETQAGTMHGTNPNVVDSDGDGATQGADMVDRNPMFPIEGYVTRATPQVDGVIGETEGWTLVSDQVNFHNPFLFTTVVDTDQHQDTRVWVAWDSTALYLAMEFSTANVQFNIDGNGNGWFAGYDNYRLEFNTDSLYWVAVAAADKDLMFSIDSSGGWSEIFDNSDKWLSQPPDGLGLDRLIDPDDVEFARTSGSEGNTFVEIRIPSNPRGAFEPGPGQEVKLYVRLDGDVLWDEDMFVRILLVDPVDTDGDGLWDLQESDLGSHPGLIDGDSDGLADVEELARGFDPLKADTDGDGLKDVIDPLPLDPRYNLDSPTGINASDGTYMDKVRVTWNDVAGEDSYTVYRCSTTNIDSCRQLATTAAGMTIYDDIGANADGTVHYYRVCACSIEDGCSGISDANSGNRFTDLIFRNGFESD